MRRFQDREYAYYAGTSDDGWLSGGGENGDSFSLPNTDSGSSSPRVLLHCLWARPVGS